MESSANIFLRACGNNWTARFAYFLTAFVTGHASMAAEKVNWRSAAEVRQELETQIGINWPNNPLKNSLGNLSRARRVAIWLDRRIDPDQQVKFEAKDVVFRDALRSLAGELNAGICLVGPVVYIGPKQSVTKLQALSAQRRDEAGKLPDAQRRKFAQSRAWQWDELTEPRELLKELAAEGGLTLADVDKVPHDLWAAGDFPALPLADRLSLALAGFDQTYKFSSDGTSLEISQYPQSAAVAGVEKPHLVKGDVAAAAEKIAKIIPSAKIKTAPGRILVTATPDEHVQIEEMLKRPTTVKVPAVGGEKRYTLKIDGKPVGDALRAIVKQVEMDLQLDPGVTQERLSTKVSFQVKDATLDELFKNLLEPAGLAFKISGKKIEVFEKKQ